MTRIFNVFAPIGLASLVTLTTLSNTAFAAPPPAGQSFAVIPVKDGSDVVKLMLVSEAHYRITLQAEYVDVAEGGQKYLIDDRTKNKKLRAGLKEDVELVFDAFTDILSGTGHLNPSELYSPVLEYMATNGCTGNPVTAEAKTMVGDKEVTYQKVTKIEFTDVSPGACQALLDNSTAFFDEKLALVPDQNDPIIKNAIKLRQGVAISYTPGDGVILMLAPLVELNAVLPEDKRFWNMGGEVSPETITETIFQPITNPYEAVKHAKGAGDRSAFGQEFVPGDLDESSANPLIGRTAYVYRRGQPNNPRKGKVTDVTPEGIMVDDELVTFEDIQSEEAIVTLGEPGGERAEVKNICKAPAKAAYEEGFSWALSVDLNQEPQPEPPAHVTIHPDCEAEELAAYERGLSDGFLNRDHTDENGKVVSLSHGRATSLRSGINLGANIVMMAGLSPNLSTAFVMAGDVNAGWTFRAPVRITASFGVTGVAMGGTHSGSNTFTRASQEVRPSLGLALAFVPKVHDILALNMGIQAKWIIGQGNQGHAELGHFGLDVYLGKSDRPEGKKPRNALSFGITGGRYDFGRSLGWYYDPASNPSVIDNHPAKFGVVGGYVGWVLYF